MSHPLTLRVYGEDSRNRFVHIDILPPYTRARVVAALASRDIGVRGLYWDTGTRRMAILSDKELGFALARKADLGAFLRYRKEPISPFEHMMPAEEEDEARRPDQRTVTFLLWLAEHRVLAALHNPDLPGLIAPLTIACREENVRSVRTFVEWASAAADPRTRALGDVNAPACLCSDGTIAPHEHYMETPIQAAGRRDDAHEVEIARYLLSQGADPVITPRDTALTFARNARRENENILNEAMVRLLIEHRGNVNLGAREPTYPYLSRTFLFASPPTITLLLNACAYVHTKTAKLTTRDATGSNVMRLQYNHDASDPQLYALLEHSDAIPDGRIPLSP